jgi:hypothetical protein
LSRPNDRFAAAALEQAASKAIDPSDADVQKFYDGNPALFAQHASYEFSLFNSASEGFAGRTDIL